LVDIYKTDFVSQSPISSVQRVLKVIIKPLLHPKDSGATPSGIVSDIVPPRVGGFLEINTFSDKNIPFKENENHHQLFVHTPKQQHQLHSQQQQQLHFYHIQKKVHVLDVWPYNNKEVTDAITKAKIGKTRSLKQYTRCNRVSAITKHTQANVGSQTPPTPLADEKDSPLFRLWKDCWAFACPICGGLWKTMEQ